ncbi:3'-5' exonuclease [Photobacterium damselae]|uniref:3'-5' exonuclease n=1 Tax=Photobacterium damselae TaxID=38293 RepID=UPI001F18C3AC|nr:3'-5' exonuclease [Photobacterium damselae]UKA04539.1 exonuclease domain-containing protein [Photobacterium damselae subsp. damselae]
MYSSWRGKSLKKQPAHQRQQRHFNCGLQKSSGKSFVLCVDLEFNISHDNKLNNKEVVEIGVVLIDKVGCVIDRFSSFCSPSYGCVTSETLEFINVERQLVESAPDLKVVLKNVDDHFSKYLDDVDYWCSWGDMDLNVIQFQMMRMGLASKIFGRIKYVNAQDRYDHQQNNYRRTSLSNAIFRHGLAFRGDAHRALSDADALGSLVKLWVL